MAHHLCCIGICVLASRFMYLYWDLCTCIAICDFLGICGFLGCCVPCLGHCDCLGQCETCIGCCDKTMHTLLDATCATSSLILRGRLSLLDHLIKVVAFENHKCLTSTHLASFEDDVGWFWGATHLGRHLAYMCGRFEHFLEYFEWTTLLFCWIHMCEGLVDHFEDVLYYFDEVDLPRWGNLLYFDHVFLTFDENVHLRRLLHIFWGRPSFDGSYILT